VRELLAVLNRMANLSEKNVATEMAVAAMSKALLPRMERVEQLLRDGRADAVLQAYREKALHPLIAQAGGAR